MPKHTDVLPEFTPGSLTYEPVPVFQYQRTLAEELAAGLDHAAAWSIYDCMLYVRFFEEMIIQLKNGKFEQLPGYKFIGATHLSIGQEAVGVGAMSALHGDDLITSTHRGHGHSVAKGYYWLQGASNEELAAFIGTEVEKSRTQLRSLSAAQLVAACARLRPDLDNLTEPVQAAKLALRSIASRIQNLDIETRLLRKQLDELTQAAAPATSAVFGLGWSPPPSVPASAHCFAC